MEELVDTSGSKVSLTTSISTKLEADPLPVKIEDTSALSSSEHNTRQHLGDTSTLLSSPASKINQQLKDSSTLSPSPGRNTIQRLEDPAILSSYTAHNTSLQLDDSSLSPAHKIIQQLEGPSTLLSSPTHNTSLHIEGPSTSAAAATVILERQSSEVDKPSTSAEVKCPSYIPSKCETKYNLREKEGSQLGKDGEACVSSQQRDSPSSDEDEDDDSWDQGDCDNGSEVSELSDFSQESWQPVQGPISWVQEQMRLGQSPRKILEDLVPTGTVIPEGLDPIMLWKIIINIVSEPPRRKKLNDINTLDDILQLLNTSKKIIVLTGAGVSVSCGIPDFRSRGGVYARLAKDFPNLPDPQAMFDIHFFRSDPRPFFKFAREIYPGQFKPSPCHRFIRMLEEKGKLLRNYTQNIDTLEQVAGIQRVVQCHGSFATATCTVCGLKVDSNAIKEDIFNQVIPHCPKCSISDQKAVMKPDIVFFGESLPEHFHNQMAADKDECDMLIVIGSSLKVRPVALIPNSLPANVPQILINRERLHYLSFDVELLGNCDEIIGELCRRLGPGWEELASSGPPIDEVLMSSLPTPPASPHCSESKGRWDNPTKSTVSSSKTEAISLKQIQSPSSDCNDNTSNSATISENCDTTKVISTQENNNVQEVSFSKSEPRLTKVQKAHNLNHKYHKHSLKRSLSNTTADVPLENSTMHNPDSDQAIFCSAKSVETLACVCHKKDVMFVPDNKSFEHHSQYSYDRAKNQHQTLSSIHELSDSSASKQNHHSSQTCNIEQNSNLPAAQTSKETHNNPKSCVERTQKRLSLDALKEVQKIPSCSKSLEAANNNEADTELQCSLSKKPRLLHEESLDKDSTDTKDDAAGKSAVCDSMSLDESLDEMGKVWCNRNRVSLAQRLEGNQVLFLPPSRYVFKGAEVYSDSESETSDDSDDYSCDDNESSACDDADKSIEDITTPEQAEKDKDIFYSVPTPKETELNQQNSGDAQSTKIIMPAENTPANQSDSGKDSRSETTSISEAMLSSSSDVTYKQSRLNESLATCPVSSTEDLYLEQTAQISTRLHSLQDQRD